MELILTLVAAGLALAASAAGLLVEGLYRDPDWLVPQARGQDLVTLVAALALAAVAVGRWSRSPRAGLVRVGLLGYLLYTYVGAAFAYAYNELFLVYVAAFSTSLFATLAAVRALDVPALARSFDDGVPRRSVTAYLVLVACMLSVLWLGQIVPALFAGAPPESIVRSAGSLKYVFALDLGVVVPLSATAALWLLRRRPWGFVLAGIILIKALTMGLALLAMTGFSVQAGQPLEFGLFVPWIALSSASLAMSVWFLRHCRGAASVP